MTLEEVQAQVDEIGCDFCSMDQGMVQYVILAAMLDVANGDEVPMTLEELIEEANCLICSVPPGLVPYLQLQALREISTGGGGGGGSSCCNSGTGSPEGVVSGSPGHTYFDTSSDGFWVKRTGTNTTTGWLQLIV